MKRLLALILLLIPYRLIFRIRHWSLVIKDQIRYHPLPQMILGLGFLIRSFFSTRYQLHYTLLAHRILVGCGYPDWLRSRVTRLLKLSHAPTELRYQCFQTYGEQTPGKISKGLILKLPENHGERGVLLLFFESNAFALLQIPRIEELLSLYRITVFTSWFPPAYAPILYLAQFPHSSIGVSISHPQEYPDHAFPKDPRIFRIPLMMSDFLDPETIPIRSKEERDIDIICVANWAPFKRHWQLLNLLAQLRDRVPWLRRVVLVGQPECGIHLANIQRLAKEYQVNDMIEFYESIPFRQVTDLMSRSKIALLLSKREGACVANAECLFAGTPVGILEGAQIGSSAYINSQTGAFLRESRLLTDVIQFLEHWKNYDPRNWAIHHISAHKNISKMNEILREQALQNQEPWTKDILPFHLQVVPVHYPQSISNTLKQGYQYLRDQYGIHFSVMDSL